MTDWITGAAATVARRRTGERDTHVSYLIGGREGAGEESSVLRLHWDKGFIWDTAKEIIGEYSGDRIFSVLSLQPWVQDKQWPELSG